MWCIELSLTTPRRQWADYFDSEGIQYAFFSAANATAIQEARRDALAAEQERLEAEQRAQLQGSDEEIDEEEEEEEEEVIPEEISERATPPPDTPLASDVDGEIDGDEEDDEDGYSTESHDFHLMDEDDTEDGQDPRARVLSVLELEDLFIRAAPDLNGTSLSWTI